MKNARFVQAFVEFVPRASVMFGSLGLAALLGMSAMAQDKKATDAKKDTVKDDYIIHQSFDLGGHVANTAGSPAMYATMVNLQTGPRILNQTLDMHATGGSKHALFDTLFENSTGYGGDPNAYSTLRFSKGKSYDFVGSFRRDRQYFDYNLWANPLIPGGATAPTSNGYTFPQIQDASHFFNTVRRNTDANLTILPISVVSFRAGYNLNVMQGPSQSSLHQGADALLNQNWSNSTETFLGAIDWKPVKATTLTFEQHVTAYKGNTYWTLADANMQLPNGAPVTLGFDNATGVGASSGTSGCGSRPAVVNSGTAPPTANPCVNSYTGYQRQADSRTLFPTEEFRFQSSTIKNVHMTGRMMYTGASMTLPAYNEVFTGLESRVTAALPMNPTPPAFCTETKNSKGVITAYNDCLAVATITGSAKAQRINVSADYGVVFEVSKDFRISEQFDFQNWRQPSISTLTEVDQFAVSSQAAPAITGAPAVTAPVNFLGQKSEANTLVGEWDAASWIQVGLGYRYRTRTIGFIQSIATDALASGRNYTQQINENSTFLDLVIRPNREWRINGSVETGWADAAYVQTDPRQFQHYQTHITYKPNSWATISAAYNDRERRDNETMVNYKAHLRAGSGTVSLAPNDKFAVDMNYGYIDVFSTAIDCFDASVQPPGTTPMPVGVVCGNASNSGTSAPSAFYGNSEFDAPTQYGSASVVVTPVKAFRTAFGYRVSDVDGSTQYLNPLNVAGTLQSRYSTPYVNLAYSFSPAWTMKADYNYYGYGEDGPAGPTAPRNFHSNIYTLGMHYQF